MSTAVRTDLVFVHSSDELYGADRVVLEMVAALSALPAVASAEVWLPTDLAHPVAALCAELEAFDVVVRHVDLPILRRSYRGLPGLFRLGRRSLGLTLKLARARPRVVYCTTSAAFIAAPLARLTRVPRVIGHIQEVWSPSDRRRLSTPARACQEIVAATNAVIAALPDRLAARTTVIANGTPEPHTLVALEGRTGPVRFVMASRWTPRKGHATLLAAWDQLEAPGLLVVLGGPPPIGESVDVAALAAALHRPASVRIVGESVGIGAFLDDADVVLVPSDEPESFGLVAIEAFAHGRPVIASATGGLIEIVRRGETGWLFEPGDVDGLAALLAAITRDEIIDAGKRARRAYEEQFTSEAFGRRWRSVVFG